MIDLHKKTLELLQDGRIVATSFIVSRSGSVPTPLGARILLTPGEKFFGTVGGGSLEAQALKDCRHTLETGEPLLSDMEFNNRDAAGEGMICGGRVKIYSELLKPSIDLISVFSCLVENLNSGRRLILASALQSGRGVSTVRAVLDDSGFTLAVSGDYEKVTGKTAEAHKNLAEDLVYLEFDREYTRSSGYRAVFLERFDPVPDLIIFGAGHVAEPLALFAARCGFAVTVVDDRGEFANRERFSEAGRIIVDSVENAFSILEIGRGSFIVAVTRGHLEDMNVVERALGTQARYIGMIGSRRKAALIRDKLRETGFEQAQIDRINSPVGLDISAETPEEIAVSILGQLIEQRRK